ncbi:MAG: peptidoglycan DD-metalloendopeptidase family protein [Bacteroidota bacterium]
MIQQLQAFSFHPVVPFDKANDKLLLLDFTSDNTQLTDGLLNSTSLFSVYINKQLEKADARYGIGGYDEHRTVYRFSSVFDGDKTGEEPRRLHLGTDIWGKPHTAVMAPLDGIVHSFAFNNNPGDYGTTIILTHNISDPIAKGFTFYTLYGHLSLSSIKNLGEGERIEKGDVLAEYGIPAENGGWPPHLHFQIIYDIGEWKCDYPGVCKFSEKDKWLANSPDPDIILQMNQYLQH